MGKLLLFIRSAEPCVFSCTLYGNVYWRCCQFTEAFVWQSLEWQKNRKLYSACIVFWSFFPLWYSYLFHKQQHNNGRCFNQKSYQGHRHQTAILSMTHINRKNMYTHPVHTSSQTWLKTRHIVGYVGNKQEDDNNTANSEIIQYSNRFEERNKTLFVCVRALFSSFFSPLPNLFFALYGLCPLPMPLCHSLLLFYSINKK